MFERISRGMELATASLGVLRQEKKFLVFPLFSGIACLLVLASFALPLWATGYATLLADDHKVPHDPLAYILLFAFYFANYSVIIFFNSALIHCAAVRFRGGDPTVTDGLSAAVARLPQIIGWALVSATVGVILKAIESRSEKVGQFVAGLLGAGWSIATYFVVPVLVVEKVGPIAAIERSFAILRKTWGESLTAQFSIGLAVMLASLLAMVPAVLGFLLGNMATVIVGMTISVLLIILISLVSTALQTIVVVALYLYAAEGKVPEQFDERLLRDAYVPK